MQWGCNLHLRLACYSYKLGKPKVPDAGTCSSFFDQWTSTSHFRGLNRIAFGRPLLRLPNNLEMWYLCSV